MIVGIGGKLRHGKDEIADRLVNEHGWVKIGMSDGLADALYTLNPWILLPTALGWRNRFTASVARLFKRPPRPVYVRYQWLADAAGYVGAKENKEVRRLLQILGTEIGRKMIDEDVWVDMMVNKVKKAMVGVPGVIVTGVRFPNEIEAISETLGGELWWVVRPLAAGDNAAHDSENSVNSVDFDRVIRNDGTLKELYAKVDDLVS